MPTTFSIVIPTRRRADTLRKSLETALAVEWEALQIVVQNNGNDPATAAVVREANDPRVLLAGTDEVLPMRENWERALASATGEYVYFMGDDDGVLPDACLVADLAIAKTGAHVLSWSAHSYWWPTTSVTYQRNRLYVTVPRGELDAEAQHSIPTLQAFYGGRVPYTDLPMIYNSAFVHRAVIDKVRARCGSYFPSMTPDVYSGIANLWAVDHAVRLARPLGIGGVSGHSIGTSGTYRSFGVQAHDQFMRETGSGLTGDSYEAYTLEAALFNEQQIAKRLLFADEPRIVCDPQVAVALVAANVNRDPGNYDGAVEYLRWYAAHRGVDLTNIPIPPRAQPVTTPYQGIFRDGDGRARTIAIDGARAGISDIAGACRLVDAMMFDLRPLRRSA